MITSTTIIQLETERLKQFQKFGKEPLASADAMCRILGEEYGEVCRAVNQGAHLSEILKELLQVAAVAIAYLDNDLHDGRQK